MTRHGLSFDLEDWHQLCSMRIGDEPGEPVNVEEDTARILDLCDELGVRGTFFTLGLLARQRPQLIRRVAERGHEIGSHSLHHKLVHRMTRAELLADLRDSKALLEDTCGNEVIGYRAPEFSVGSLDSPCFELLREAGFRYDSSVFPVDGLRYGIPDAPHAPFRIPTAAGDLWELPLATIEVGSRRLPIAGGSHFRLLPTRFVAWAARRAEARSEPLVFYFHPYEFTRHLLYLAGGARRNRPIAKHLLLHNFATRRIERSLRAVLAELDLGPLRDFALGEE